MKILEAFGEPISYGGQEAFVLNVLEKMDSSGLETDLLTPYYCDNQNAHFIAGANGGQVYELSLSFRPGSIRNGAERKILSFLRSHSYDVIHIHSGSSSMLEIYARLAHRAGIPRIIVHSHSTGYNDWKHRASKFATSFGLRKYPTDYCACSVEAGEWRFPMDICRNSLRVIADGIDAYRFRFDPQIRSKMRKEFGLSDDDIVIGNAGRLVSQKNQLYLIYLLDSIRGIKGGERYKLVIAGDGEDREKLKEHVSSLGLDDSVLFTGLFENICDFYQAVDVLAIPSVYEGFCIAAAEGQAAGLDVIVSDRVPKAAGITESITFIPLENREAWISAIMSHHERHAGNADMIAESAYDIRKVAAGVREMYLEGK